MIRRLWLLLVLAAGLGCYVQSAQGAITAVEWEGDPSSNWSQNSDAETFTGGFRFQVTSDINVVQLGAFDANRNGLEIEHTVGLWSVSGNVVTLLATVVVPAADAAVLEGDFRYMNIAPVTLTPGQQYVVGASRFGVPETAAQELLPPGLDAADEISNISHVRGMGDGLVFPNNPLPEGGLVAFGGNFRFEFASEVVPEPSTFALLSLGACGFMIPRIWQGRRRARSSGG